MGAKVLDITCETVFIICYDMCFHKDSNSLVVALPDHTNNHGFFLLQQYCVDSGRFRSHIDVGDYPRCGSGLSVVCIPRFDQAHSKLVLCDGYGINVFKVRLDLKDNEDPNPPRKYSPDYDPEHKEKLQKELVDKAQRASKLNKRATVDISAKGVGKLHKRDTVDHRLELRDNKDASKLHKRNRPTVDRAKGVGKRIKRGKEGCNVEGVRSLLWDNISLMIGLVCFLAAMLALYLYE